MARLNEAPAITESVEALKRRFMRQNRELAKSNSELKIKVATLEADRAQLLSENITLRDQNIRLTEEAARDYARNAIRNVGQVKDKLVAKVAELTELMQELEVAQAKPKHEPKPKPERRKSYKRSPASYRNWKLSLHGPEVTGLAPILEDKYYPRETLNAEELRELLPDAGTGPESPEIGSPPVSHFDMLRASGSSSSTNELLTSDEIEETDTQQPVLPSDLFNNLETRRKRRTSGLIRDSIDDQKPPEEVVEAKEIPALQQPLLKAGAKRKFDVRSDEENQPRVLLPDTPSFSFSRKATTTGEEPVARQVKQAPGKIVDRKMITGNDGATRKALGDKTVNTDPIVSPVKARIVPEKSARQDLLEKVKEREKRRQQARIEKKPEKNRESPLSVKTNPATPRASEADLFSPTDSITSTNPGAGSMSGQSELTSRAAENTRPSRRQRAQVSYAEPSLRDKMRRPGKELADAVVADKSAKEETIKSEGSPVPEPKPDVRRAIVEPISPLQNKSSNGRESLPTTAVSDRKRKSLQSGEIDAGMIRSDTSRVAAAALLSSQQRLSKVRGVEIQKPVEGQSSDIFNIEDSSPESIEQKLSGRQHRRHSSMAELKEKKELGPRTLVTEVKPNADISRAERMASRRRSMQT